MERTNPLALLASEVRLIADKELTEFSLVLSDWYPEAARVAAVLLHQLYGERLVCSTNSWILCFLSLCS